MREHLVIDFSLFYCLQHLHKKAYICCTKWQSWCTTRWMYVFHRQYTKKNCDSVIIRRLIIFALKQVCWTWIVFKVLVHYQIFYFWCTKKSVEAGSELLAIIEQWLMRKGIQHKENLKYCFIVLKIRTYLIICHNMKL